MLQPVEVLPRRSVRRGVSLEVDVIAQRWDGPRRHRALDLSPDGLRLAAGGLLPVGEHVVVCFTPPGWWVLGELAQWARVARATPRSSEEPAILGLELVDLAEGARAELERALSGRPPPLPRTRKRRRCELMWVDALADVELDPEELEVAPAPLAPLLTGGQSPPSSCR